MSFMYLTKCVFAEADTGILERILLSIKVWWVRFAEFIFIFHKYPMIMK